MAQSERNCLQRETAITGKMITLKSKEEILAEREMKQTLNEKQQNVSNHPEHLKRQAEMDLLEAMEQGNLRWAKSLW